MVLDKYLTLSHFPFYWTCSARFSIKAKKKKCIYCCFTHILLFTISFTQMSYASSLNLLCFFIPLWHLSLYLICLKCHYSFSHFHCLSNKLSHSSIPSSNMTFVPSEAAYHINFYLIYLESHRLLIIIHYET